MSTLLNALATFRGLSFRSSARIMSDVVESNSPSLHLLAREKLWDDLDEADRAEPAMSDKAVNSKKKNQLSFSNLAKGARRKSEAGHVAPKVSKKPTEVVIAQGTHSPGMKPSLAQSSTSDLFFNFDSI